MTVAATDLAHQVAALPLRRAPDGSLLVLLITTLQTFRWIIPKGWPVPGKQDIAAALDEAREEAGVVGEAEAASIGSYVYVKRRSSGPVMVEVAVYLLEVREELDTWPECKRRQRAWFTVADAAALVEEPGLKDILSRLASENGLSG